MNTKAKHLMSFPGGIKQIIYSAAGVLLIMVLAGCPGAGTTDEDVLQQMDETDPVVVIASPADGVSYGPSVTVEGTITDLAAESVDGRVDSAGYELAGTIFQDDITVSEGGSFSFSFSTAGVPGDITVTVTAVDWNGNEGSDSVVLAVPMDLASFSFPAEHNTSLAEDAEGVITGTDIEVGVPDGTDVDELIASFVCTGTSVAVDGTVQESGVSVNDFRTPVEYVVTANDSRTRTFTVSVSAVPLSPADFTLDSLTNDSLELSWTCGANNEDGFRLERRAGTTGDFTLIADLDPDSTDYTDSSFSGAPTYYYRLCAYNDSGQSAWEELEVDATPAAPTGLSLTAEDATHVALDWNHDAVNELGFRIQRKEGAGGTYMEIDTTGEDVTEYIDTGLSGTTEYYYRVRAYNDHGASSWSDETNVTTLQFTQYSEIASSITGNCLVSAADLDNDGDDDAVVFYFPNTWPYDLRIMWYENTDGSGSFSQSIDIDASAYAKSLYSADLDGDGDMDVLSGQVESAEVSGTTNNITWYRNNGSGSFGSGNSVTDSYKAVCVFAADLDGDGDNDLLASNGQYADVLWYENTDGAGSFSDKIEIDTDAPYAQCVFAADLDNDGDSDVVSAVLGNDEITWYENSDGNGTFSPGTQIEDDLEDACWVTAADLDGNGYADIIACGSAADCIRWYSNSGGSFSAGVQVGSTISSPGKVVTADFDNDGDLDIMSFTFGAVHLYENTDGSGAFADWEILSSGYTYAYDACASDLDGDGDVDVLFTAGPGTISGYLGWFENTLYD